MQGIRTTRQCEHATVNLSFFLFFKIRSYQSSHRILRPIWTRWNNRKILAMPQSYICSRRRFLISPFWQTDRNEVYQSQNCLIRVVRHCIMGTGRNSFLKKGTYMCLLKRCGVHGVLVLKPVLIVTNVVWNFVWFLKQPNESVWTLCPLTTISIKNEEWEGTKTYDWFRNLTQFVLSCFNFFCWCWRFLVPLSSALCQLCSVTTMIQQIIIVDLIY